MSRENIPPSSETRPTNPKTTCRNPQQDRPAVKCPRCDAWNTKFCYYNNYCITQPRHFCKNCRRYWTKGGTLRNVPIGGGYRKSKKLKTDSTTSSKQFSLGGGGSGELGPVFTGPNPSVELHLGGVPLPRLYSPAAGMYTQYHASCSVPTLGYGHGTDDVPGPYFGLGLLGLNNYPLHSSSSASSRGDNLSSINQEMYWKLRQQRFAMMYGPSTAR